MSELTTTDQYAILDGLTKAEAITPTSLTLEKGMPYDTYEALGTMLGALGRSCRWWVGDWLLFGEVAFGDDKVAQAAHATGLSEGTLLNYRWVCEHVPRSRRRLDVSFSVHSEVAPLPPNEQRRYLALAARENMTQRELRHRIQQDKASADPAAESVGGGDASAVGAGRVSASDELTKAARNLWKHAQPDGDGFYRVPVEFIRRIGALIGEEE